LSLDSLCVFSVSRFFEEELFVLRGERKREKERKRERESEREED